MNENENLFNDYCRFIVVYVMFLFIFRYLVKDLFFMFIVFEYLLKYLLKVYIIFKIIK